MTSLREGALVTVAGKHVERDGIVFHVPSATKIIVAVPDASRGPVLRTVHPDAVSAREAAGEHDPALLALIRRTPSMGRSGPRGDDGPGQGSRGHTRAPAHRATGR